MNPQQEHNKLKDSNLQNYFITTSVRKKNKDYFF